MAFNFREELKKLDEETQKRVLPLFEQSENAINDAIEKVISKPLTAAAVAALLVKIQAIINATLQAVKNPIQDTVLNGYLLGATEAQRIVDRKLSIELLKTEQLGAQELSQAKALMQSVYDNVATQLQAVRSTTSSTLSQALRTQIRQRVALGLSQGDAVDTIAKSLRDELFVKDGVTAFLDKRGRRIGLIDYARTTTRSMVINAANDATTLRMDENGLSVWQVSTHVGGAEDEACATHQGKIYDNTGKLYPKPQEDDFPPYHPNCRHVMIPRPDLQFSI